MKRFNGNNLQELQKAIEADIKAAIARGVIGATTEVVRNSPTVFETQLGQFAGTEADPVKYPGGISNVVGEYKNSWWATTEKGEVSERQADPTGFDSIQDAYDTMYKYKFQPKIYIYNGANHAAEVEQNWGVVEDSTNNVIKALKDGVEKGKGG